MKALLLLSALISVKSFAFPSVGDYARYEAKFRGEKFVMEKSLVEYFPERRSYSQVTRIMLRGEVVQEQVNELDQMWLYTDAKVQNVLKTCTRREGALGVTMIEDKEIKTCTFYNEDAQLDYVIGTVPFGQVRFQIYVTGEEFLDFHLVGFKNE